MNQTTLNFLETIINDRDAANAGREEIFSHASALLEKYSVKSDVKVTIPSETDFFDLCRLAGLDLYRTLLIVLKSQFERYAIENSELKMLPSALEALRELSEKTALARSHASPFYPGKACGTMNVPKLHALFNAGWADAGFSPYEFIDLVNVMLASNIFFERVDSREVDYFIRNHRREIGILRLMEPAEREELLIKKSMVQELEKQFDDAIYDLNQKKLMIANLNSDFYEQFGDVYLVIAKNEQAYSKLSRMVQIKRALPDITREELEEAETETRRKEAEILENLETDIINSKYVKFNVENLLKQFTEEDLKNVDLEGYKRQLKKTEREIYTLTHPDMLENTVLTEKQKIKLCELFRRSIEVTGEETGFSIRLVSSLTEILESARAIWRSMGADVDTRFEVEGKNAGEQLAFLGRRITKLKENIAQVKNMTFNFMNDPDAKEKLACLSSKHAVKEMIGQFEKKNLWYDMQIRELESELDNLFGPENFGNEAN